MRLTTVLLLMTVLAAPVPPLEPDLAPQAASPRGSSPSASTPYTFESGAGVLLFYVKPDKGAEFEAVVARIRHVLDSSRDPARRQQADGWRIYKSVEATAHPMFVFVFDPAIAAVDYDPIKMLGEALPQEVQGLYAQLKDAVVKVERLAMTKVR
jgi:hypothetical protein